MAEPVGGGKVVHQFLGVLHLGGVLIGETCFIMHEKR